jgi:lipopolysaccharide heptosyltransferase II
VTSCWKDSEHVLCVRLDTLGDVLMTGPAIRALREARPGRRITLLTSPAGAAVAELMPEVDDTIVYQAPWMKGYDRPPETAIVEELRTRGFDGAAVFTVFDQSPLPAALLCHQAGVPLRLAHCREKPYALLTDWVPEPEQGQPTRHEVRRQLDLVAAIGATTRDERLAVEIPAAARERVARLVASAGGWAVIHPGGTAPSRRYPIELWAQVCELLACEHGLELIVTGDEADRELAAALPRTRSVAGELSLAELAALLAEAPLLLAGNTGPVHLAAAVGTPVVDLYALTNPQHTPWMVDSKVLSHDVPCRWCYGSVCREGHHLCLRGVPPEQVVEAALALLPPVSSPPRRVIE